MDIDPNTEQALTELAALKDVSLNTLLSEFVTTQTRYLQEREEDRQRLENARQNGGVSHDEMKAHFEALRARVQLYVYPPPKSVAWV